MKIMEILTTIADFFSDYWMRIILVIALIGLVCFGLFVATHQPVSIERVQQIAEWSKESEEVKALAHKFAEDGVIISYEYFQIEHTYSREQVRKMLITDQSNAKEWDKK